MKREGISDTVSCLQETYPSPHLFILYHTVLQLVLHQWDAHGEQLLDGFIGPFGGTYGWVFVHTGTGCLERLCFTLLPLISVSVVLLSFAVHPASLEAFLVLRHYRTPGNWQTPLCKHLVYRNSINPSQFNYIESNCHLRNFERQLRIHSLSNTQCYQQFLRSEVIQEFSRCVFLSTILYFIIWKVHFYCECLFGAATLAKFKQNPKYHE